MYKNYLAMISGRRCSKVEQNFYLEQEFSEKSSTPSYDFAKCP